MLQYLRIENLALIGVARFELDAGLVAVTGETGAGKSILLGAIQLLGGGRTQKSIIRQGADECRVEGLVQCREDSPVHTFLAEAGLPPAEEGSLLIKRVVHREKPSRVEINGSLATLQQLQQLGELWLDIHGPGEPQRLYREREQLRLVDAFARNAPAFQRYAGLYERWMQGNRELQRLRKERSLTPDEAQFLQSQIDRIDALDLSVERIEELERDWQRLDRFEDVRSAGGDVLQALSDEDGVGHYLARALQRLGSWAQFDPEVEALRARLESVGIEVADLTGEIEAILTDMEWDEETIQAIRQTMAEWLDLRRRHGGTLEGVLDYRREIGRRLAEQTDLAGTLDRLATEVEDLNRQLRELARELHLTRLSAARQLEKEVSKLLLKLGFRKAGFKIEIGTEAEPGATGQSSIEMVFSPNAGQALLPLRQIASSGEMARVMLALKAVLARVDATPVLVFDEVDSNVGGEVGRTLGRELALLAEHHQVFCVTHLPQVASLAASHWYVEKQQDQKETTVRFQPLHTEADPSLREEEIARMLGDRGSSVALEMARELLSERAGDL